MRTGEFSLYDSGASWIWIPEDVHAPSQYVQFRHEFILKYPTDGTRQLLISTDSDYSPWLNGNLVGFGQYDYYPDDKTYEVIRSKKR